MCLTPEATSLTFMTKRTFTRDGWNQLLGVVQHRGRFYVLTAANQELQKVVHSSSES